MKTALVIALLAFTTAAQAQDINAWRVDTPKDLEASLAYGGPTPDQASLVFKCAPKSGQVQMWVSLANPPPPSRPGFPVPASVSLTSDLANATLRGTVKADPAGGGSIANTEFSTKAPVVAAFRKSGMVRLSVLGETVEPLPAKASLVRKFLGVCK